MTKDYVQKGPKNYVHKNTVSSRWYAFLCGLGSDMLFKIEHLWGYHAPNLNLACFVRYFLMIIIIT